jgi:SAM-dependent methyltransferase
MMPETTIETTAEYWDRYVTSPASANRAEWYAHPLVQERFLRLRDGQSLEGWFVTKYLAGHHFRRGLGIGAGVATLELNLVQLGAIETVDLYDVSQGSLDVARETARSMNIEDRVRYFCADVTDVAFTGSYDVVTFISSLHHIENLEATLTQMHSILSPEGVLLANEYVGPDRFGYPDEDLRIPRQLFHILDPSLKAPFPEMPLPKVADVIAADPTEAIHSADTIETLGSVFAHVEVTPLRTSLAFILWWGLNHDVLYETAQGIDLVRLILELDEMFVNEQKMPNYFAYLAASKKGFR